ncbi:hypothetical protein PMAYCL1PPCAC_25596, partial [Pristionchus mayeri]
ASQLSTHYLTGVNIFMNRDVNKPGFESVTLDKFEDALVVNIKLIPSNLLFYGLADLDWGRFQRGGDSDSLMLAMELNGAKDPIFEKLSGLFSVSIQEVEIYGYRLNMDDFSLTARLLHNSTICILKIHFFLINDSRASFIIEIASRAREMFL